MAHEHHPTDGRPGDPSHGDHAHPPGPLLYPGSPGEEFEGHGHGSPHLVFVLRGGFVEVDGDDEVHVERACFRLSRADDRHRMRFDQKTGATCVVIELDQADPLLGHRTPRRHYVRHAEVEVLVRSLLRDLAVGGGIDTLSFDCAKAEALALARRGELRAWFTPRWLSDLRERLIEEPKTARLGLVQLAREASVDRSHLAHSFRKRYGLPLGEFARRCRLRAAALALTGESETLAEIALATGFSDQAHMTREFRRLLGTTPGAYRRRTHAGSRRRGRGP